METPPLVVRALALAAEAGLAESCPPEGGALLHVLAARRGLVRAGEIGTRTGVAAAWIVAALPPRIPFVTVEIDRDRAAAAVGLFADDPDVRVLAGDWRDLMPPQAPFDLLFVAEQSAQDDVAAVVGLLAPGATVVLDDFRDGRGLPGRRRDAWLSHPLLAAVELWLSPGRRALVAVRR